MELRSILILFAGRPAGSTTTNSTAVTTLGR
jgi:hypothetical protein